MVRRRMPALDVAAHDFCRWPRPDLAFGLAVLNRQNMSIQQHPDYHEGFFDGLDGDPLFEDDCTPEYKAGWIASLP